MVDELSMFEAAQEYLKIITTPLLDTFFPFATDPFSALMIIKETENILKKQLCDKFPLFPTKYLPKCKFRMHSVEDEKFALEYNIQHYLNKDTMKYLGSCGIGKTEYDLYCRHSFDPNSDILFISKHGHGEKEIEMGSRTAEAEYQLGIVSPLAVAYGMAIQDGIITRPLE
ncbi:MAG: hypothetical protein ACTSW1_07820 [Candidatus Hodarchaeales archaeon]